MSLQGGAARAIEAVPGGSQLEGFNNFYLANEKA